jgi:hypothetical protein
LPIEQRHFAAETLNVPLRELVQDECVIAEILESLRLWLNAETELLC